MRAILRFAALGLAATLASFVLTQSRAGAQPSAETVKDLTERYANANAALLRGDAATWGKLAPMSLDFVLMSPFGGTPSRYTDYPPERIERMGKFFRNGRFQQELVQSYAVDGMIVLVTVERANIEVGGLPAQDWSLRVTSIFKEEKNGWKLAHRHADPLVADVSLAEAARLAKGQRASD